MIVIYKRKHRDLNRPIENENRPAEIKFQPPESEKKNNFNPNLFPIRFSHNLAFIGDPICTIDISGFKIGDPVIITPCMHIFHVLCINEWLNSIQREKRCPNCNFEMSKFIIHLN